MNANPAVDADPPTCTYGNIGRTLPDLRAPGVINIDASVIKDFKLNERLKLQFRAEGFNMPNHVNSGFPATGFSASRDGSNGNVNFGRIASARSPRNRQFGLKLLW